MTQAQSAGQKSSTSRAGTVVVLEDDRAVRDLLRLHLENAGYQVLAAPDVVDAGAVVIGKAREIDLLIIDAHLPYMSGIDFASTVIADTTLPAIPIIMITGHEELAARAALLDVPCLLKPFGADALVSLAARTIGSARPADAGVRSPVRDPASSNAQWLIL